MKKLILELEVDDSYFQLKEGVSQDKLLSWYQRTFIEELNDFILGKQLDNSEFHPRFKDKRAIDIIKELKVIDIK